MTENEKLEPIKITSKGIVFPASVLLALIGAGTVGGTQLGALRKEMMDLATRDTTRLIISEEVQPIKIGLAELRAEVQFLGERVQKLEQQ